MTKVEIRIWRTLTDTPEHVLIRLKIRYPCGCVSSSPSLGTNFSYKHRSFPKNQKLDAHGMSTGSLNRLEKVRG